MRRYNLTLQGKDGKEEVNKDFDESKSKLSLE